MTAGINGSDILLLCNTGTENSPVWTAVGSQRDCEFEETNEEIDMSSKDSRAYRVMAGRYSAKLSMEAVYVPNDASYLALQAALRDGELILVRREELGVALEEAHALITQMGTKAPDQDAGVLSIEMTLDDGWTAVGS